MKNSIKTHFLKKVALIGISSFALLSSSHLFAETFKANSSKHIVEPIIHRVFTPRK